MRAMNISSTIFVYEPEHVKATDSKVCGSETPTVLSFHNHEQQRDHHLIFMSQECEDELLRQLQTRSLKREQMKTPAIDTTLADALPLFTL